MDDSVNVVDPEFVIVTVRGDDGVPTTCVPKSIDVGAIPKTPPGAVPVRDDVSVGALLVTVNVPLKTPGRVGANVTLNVALLPGAIVSGSVAELIWNAVTSDEMLLTTTFEVPVFVTVNVTGALDWPTSIVPKLCDNGARVAFGLKPLPPTVTE